MPDTNITSNIAPAKATSLPNIKKKMTIGAKIYAHVQEEITSTAVVH